jgi:heterodisulfide reductase subunit B
MLDYRKKSREKIGPDGNLKRFRLRHPEIPIHCQACGESRVVDIAHKPEWKRNGAWRSAKNSTPEKVWLLCPTCHALIDRMNYDPSELGLR